MSDSGTFRQDEALIPGATIADLDMNVVKTYLTKRFEASYKSKDLTYEQIQDASADELVSLAASGMTVERLLKNFGLIRSDGGITLRRCCCSADIHGVGFLLPQSNASALSGTA